ncbi:MAG: Blp family class II bacteriocin [Pseudolactococcus laudensis]
MTNKSLNNAIALDKFSTLTEDEMMIVEGGGTATDLGKATIAGATVGATIGSIVPGLGTGLGAILGAKFGLAAYSIARYGF